MVLKALAVLLSLPLTTLLAQDRIHGPIDSNHIVILKGHVHPQAQPQYDEGPVPASTPMNYVTLHLKPSPRMRGRRGSISCWWNSQNPSSANYHRFQLTPEQFANRFGLDGSDIREDRRMDSESGRGNDSER